MPLPPNTDNLLLPRGRVYFDRFDANGNRQGWIDLGNVPDFSLNITSEKLPHYSSRSGITVKDLEKLRELANSFQWTIEEFWKTNLALAVLGEEIDISQTGNSVSDEAITARHDKWVDLDYRKISNVVVTGAGGSPTYTENTDYVVDYDEGMIKVLSTGSIANEASLLVDYDYGTLTIVELRAMLDHEVAGALKYVGDPGHGPAIVLETWKGSLSPSGEIGLIGEEWGNFQVTYELAKDETGHPNSPYFSVYHIDAGWG